MARQAGSNLITGTIDGLTFYHHPDDGYLARAKSSLTGEKVMTHPNFKQFVYTSAEFTEAIYAGKLLRKSISEVLFPAADGKLSSRMNARLLQIVQSEKESEFGKRRFDQGDVSLLTGFEFNAKQDLDQAFKSNYLISRNKANDDLYISIPSFSIPTAVEAPSYATHFQFIAARSSVDFEKGVYQNVWGETTRVSFKEQICPDLHFILQPGKLEKGIDFVVLGILFYGDLKKVPRNAISQRKRMMLKRRFERDGMVEFTGALKMVKVMRNQLIG